MTRSTFLGLMALLYRFGAIAIFAGIPLVAQADVVKCSLMDTYRSGWIPSQVWFQYSADGKTAEVYDPVTFAASGRTDRATVLINNSVRMTMAWRSSSYTNEQSGTGVSGRDSVSGSPMQVQFRATLLMGRNQMLLQAIPGNGSARVSGRGACKVVAGDLDPV